MDLRNQWTLEKLKENTSKIKKVFFYRICGTGMGAAACLLREKGLQVEGGDQRFYPPMSDYLRQTGIPLHELDKLAPDFFKQFDLIVVGNVVGKQSADARKIEECGVPFVSFPSAIGALVLSDCNVIGIAGTHGKTTTTYLATQVFENLGFNVGYLIGGVLPDRPPSKLGDGKYFFIEADEYDSAYFEKISKFRLYCMDYLILTSLEFDHADIFPNLEAIKDQFRAVIPQITSHFIFSQDYPASIDLYTEWRNHDTKKKWYFYGDHSPTGPRILSQDAYGTKFVVNFQGQNIEFKTNLTGKHNILNLTAVIVFALQQGIYVERITQAVSKLKLAMRRQEERGSYRNSIVIDDFAHHPRAVEVTIDAIKGKYPKEKILVVLEPNSATARSAIFQKEFSHSLLKADVVIMAKPEKSTTVAGMKDLDCLQIVEDLIKRGKNAQVVSSLKELRQLLDNYAGQYLFLILSNGTCLGLWESDFVKELKRDL